MTSEASLNALAPLVFDGINYQVWVVRMEAYLDASDLWEAVSEEYEVPPLSDNPTMAQINYTMRGGKGNQRQKLVYLQLSHPQFSLES